VESGTGVKSYANGEICDGNWTKRIKVLEKWVN